MTAFRSRFEHVWEISQQGDRARALALLEAMQTDVLAARDEGAQATYLQTLAGLLDELGRYEEAYDAAHAALAIDLRAHPDSAGTFMSMHSLYLIAKRLGRDEEAAAQRVAMLALGEKLGGRELAAAAVIEAEQLRTEGKSAEAAGLLKRARFVCTTWGREEQPRGRERAAWASELALVLLDLAKLRLVHGYLVEAEETAGQVTQLVSAFDVSTAPLLAQRLGGAWSVLRAAASERTLRSEARILAAYALDVYPRPRHASDASMMGNRAQLEDVLSALGGDSSAPPLTRAFRVLRTARERDEIVVAHPLRGRYVVRCDQCSGGVDQVGVVVDVTFDRGSQIAGVVAPPLSAP